MPTPSKIDPDTVEKLAGFERVAEVGAEGPNTSRHYISLNMEAFKP